MPRRGAHFWTKSARTIFFIPKRASKIWVRVKNLRFTISRPNCKLTRNKIKYFFTVSVKISETVTGTPKGIASQAKYFHKNFAKNFLSRFWGLGFWILVLHFFCLSTKFSIFNRQKPKTKNQQI